MKVLLAALVIAAAACAAYAPVWSAGFVADDAGAVAENITIRHATTAFAPPHDGTPVEGRPLVNASFALNFALGGLRPFGYHLFNLLLHLCAACLVFGLALQTEKERARWAFAVGVCWAVHPLASEAVAYVSQRSELLMAVFYLLTLFALARGWLAVSVASCFLGMASKEVMATAPLMALLYDRAFLSGSFAEAWRRRRGYYLWLASSWVLLAVLVAGSANRAGTAGFSAGLSWWRYALAQIGAISHYLRLCFWPHPLLADYGRVLTGSPGRVAFDGLVLAGLITGTLVFLIRRSRWGFLGAWFFLLLAPTSVVPIATEIIAERRVYLSSAAVVAGVLFLVFRWLGPRLGGVASVCLACGLAVLTYRRTQVYHSPKTYWADVARKAPNNAGARMNLGNLALAAGQLAEAESDYDAALKEAPEYADAHANLGNVYFKRAKLSAAIAEYRTALRYRPTDPAILAEFGSACARQADRLAESGDLQESARSYAEAVHVLPNVAAIRVNYGYVLAQLGQNAAAETQLEAALRLQPSAADVHNNLGGLFARSGRLTEAKREFEEALRLEPGYREARDNLERVEAMLQAGGAHP